jgi:hypothetical protein
MPEGAQVRRVPGHIAIVEPRLRRLAGVKDLLGFAITPNALALGSDEIASWIPFHRLSIAPKGAMRVASIRRDNAPKNGNPSIAKTARGATVSWRFWRIDKDRRRIWCDHADGLCTAFPMLALPEHEPAPLTDNPHPARRGPSSEPLAS